MEQKPFYFILNRTLQAQKNKLAPKMKDIGLSPGQPKILSHLLQNNKCMQKELALFCNIEPATVSKILNNMIDEGLVKKTVVEGNKRASCISITEEGKKRYEKWLEICFEEEDESLYGFQLEEKEIFKSYLIRMYNNIIG